MLHHRDMKHGTDLVCLQPLHDLMAGVICVQFSVNLFYRFTCAKPVLQRQGYGNHIGNYTVYKAFREPCVHP